MLLTDEGRRLYAAASFSFQHLADTVDELMHGAHPVGISVYTTIAFAYFWLMPRLPRFRAMFPGMSIQIISSDEDFDIYKDRCDLAILFGAASWPGMEAKLLYQECISAVASPSYLRRHREMRTINDITAGTLLHLDDEKRRWVDWPQWLRRMGAQSTTSGDSLHFNNYPTLLQAAANGQGIALGWHGLIEEHLGKKILVEVLPSRLVTNEGYYVAHSAASAMKPEVLALLNWIAAEAKDAGGTGKDLSKPSDLNSLSASTTRQAKKRRTR